MDREVQVPRHPGALAKVGDSELWNLSRRLGAIGAMVDRRFVGTLPEIGRRELWKGRGRRFGSLAEYAGRVGRVGGSTVDEIVRIEKALAGYPLLWGLIESGREGWSKVRVILPFLGKKSDAEWARLVQSVPKATLEDLARGFRGTPGNPKGSPPKSPGPETQPRAAPVVAAQAIPPPRALSSPPMIATVGRAEAAPMESPPPRLGGEPAAPLTGPVLARLEALRAEKQAATGRTVTLDEIVMGLLEGNAKRSPPSSGEDQAGGTLAGNAGRSPGNVRAGYIEVVVRVAETGELFRRGADGWRPTSIPEVRLDLGERVALHEYGTLKAQAEASAARSVGNEVPPRVRRFLEIRSGGWCEVAGCRRRADHLHHLDRRAAGGRHGPDRLAMLCEPHHAACHAGLMREENEGNAGRSPPDVAWARLRERARVLQGGRNSWPSARAPAPSPD